MLSNSSYRQVIRGKVNYNGEDCRVPSNSMPFNDDLKHISARTRARRCFQSFSFSTLLPLYPLVQEPRFGQGELGRQT